MDKNANALMQQVNGFERRFYTKIVLRKQLVIKIVWKKCLREIR